MSSPFSLRIFVDEGELSEAATAEDSSVVHQGRPCLQRSKKGIR